jgi:hypothetical protein
MNQNKTSDLQEKGAFKPQAEEENENEFWEESIVISKKPLLNTKQKTIFVLKPDFIQYKTPLQNSNSNLLKKV